MPFFKPELSIYSIIQSCPSIKRKHNILFERFRLNTSFINNEIYEKILLPPFLADCYNNTAIGSFWKGKMRMHEEIFFRLVNQKISQFEILFHEKILQKNFKNFIFWKSIWLHMFLDLTLHNKFHQIYFKFFCNFCKISEKLKIFGEIFEKYLNFIMQRKVKKTCVVK